MQDTFGDINHLSKRLS